MTLRHQAHTANASATPNNAIRVKMMTSSRNVSKQIPKSWTTRQENAFDDALIVTSSTCKIFMMLRFENWLNNLDDNFGSFSPDLSSELWSCFIMELFSRRRWTTGSWRQSNMQWIMPYLYYIVFRGLTLTQQLSTWANTAFISWFDPHLFLKEELSFCCWNGPS